MTSAPATEVAARPRSNWVAPLLVLMVGSFLPPMDSGIVNVAIPDIQKALGGGADDVAWVSTAYSLGLAVFVPLSNWLAERLGLTLVHRIALIAFLVMSTMCGLAWDLNSLILFRVLAALPGSIVPVVTISMIYRIVPPDRIGVAMGLYGLGVAAAPALGPTLGGMIVDSMDWGWIFHFKTPIGIFAVLAGIMLLPKLERSPVRRRFDWLGFLTIGYGLAALIIAASKGQKWHWDSYPVLILIVSGLLSLALFVVIENEVDSPLIDMRIFLNWPFVNSLLLIGVLMVGLFATIYYTPQFLQSAQGLTARNAGLVLLPMGLFMIVLVPIAGLLYDRIGPKWPALIGMIGSVIGALLLSNISIDMTRTEAATWVMIGMFGGGLAMMPIMTNGLNWLPPHLVGYGGAMNNVMQRVASALGVAAMGVLVTRMNAQLSADVGALQTARTLPSLGGASQSELMAFFQQSQLRVQAMTYADMYLATACLSGVGVLLVLLLKRPPVAPATELPAPARPAPPPATPDEVSPEEVGRLAHELAHGSDREPEPVGNRNGW